MGPAYDTVRSVTTAEPDALKRALIERAEALGFERCGFARAEALTPEGGQLDAMIEAGRHGDMEWLADTKDVRADPNHPGMLPAARTVVVLVAPYARADAPLLPPPFKVARYAAGRDYHNVLRKRLQKLEKWLRSMGHEVRHSVDSRPVLERAWAERAGVGFVGKNCCLIVPGLGSHLFLATLVTSAEIAPDPPMKRRCGDCRLCLDVCPTDAFVEPRVLDARRCISYLTIEQEGEIEPALAARLDGWVFGCDACQDICPYNRTSLPDESTTEPFARHPRWDVPVERLMGMNDHEFDQWSLGSPLRRTGRTRFQRNLKLVLAHPPKSPDGDGRH